MQSQRIYKCDHKVRDSSFIPVFVDHVLVRTLVIVFLFPKLVESHLNDGWQRRIGMRPSKFGEPILSGIAAALTFLVLRWRLSILEADRPKLLSTRQPSQTEFFWATL